MIGGKDEASQLAKQHETYLLGWTHSAKSSLECDELSTDWSDSRDNESDIDSNSNGSNDGMSGRSRTSSSSTFPKMCGSSSAME